MKVCSVCERCYDDSESLCTEESHPALSETRAGDPDMIAGYRLERLVEPGAKIQTYRARQLDSGQTCLIRILAPRQYFDDHLREAKLAITLFHPNIVDTYDAGMLESGESYVVHEDPEGRTVREFLNDVGQPELPISIEIVRQIAETLHTLHLSGLKHGAIRPENIILTTDQERKLLVRIQNPDFGGAIARSIISNKFLIDSALDQLKYFSPEQCTGDETSPQTDVYSLGIVLYELLAGFPPFNAPKGLGLIEKHKSHPVPDIRINNYHLQMLVTHSLMEALQKQPRLRQSSANVFARQLRHIEQLATHASTLPPAGVAPAWQPIPPMHVVSGKPSTSSPDPLPAAALGSDAPKKIRLESNTDTEAEAVVPVGVEEDLSAAPVEIEREPLVAAASRTELTDDVEPLNSEAATPAGMAGEPTPAPVYLDPRSRLRGWKEKLQSLAANLTPETRPAQVTSIFDSVDRTVLKNRSDELSALQAEAIEIDRKPSRAVPKKIEWQIPDDDIPSEAEVLQVLAQEGPPEVQEFTIEPAKKIVETSATELAQAEVIEVPIPPMQVSDETVGEQIVEKLTEEETVEAPVWIAEAPVVVESPGAIETPAVFESAAWIETPIEVARPTMADEPVVEIEASPVVEPEQAAVEIRKPEQAAVEIRKSARPARKKATRTRPSEIAAKPKTPEPAFAGSASKVPAPAVPEMRPNTKASKPAAKRSGLGFPVNLADLEEITIVRPPSKRIRVDWERSVARSVKSDIPEPPRAQTTAREIGFSPTILGSAPVRKAAERKRNDEMFSATAGESEAAVPGRYHAAVLGIGIAALVGLFLFGFGSVTSYFETSSAADSMPAAEAVQEAGVVSPPVVETALPAKKVETKNSVKPTAEAKPAVEAPTTENKSSTVSEKPAATAKKADPKAKPEPSKPAKTAKAASADRAPAKPASQKPAAAKSSTVPAASKAKGSTRPRIVKDAKP